MRSHGRGRGSRSSPPKPRAGDHQERSQSHQLAQICSAAGGRQLCGSHRWRNDRCLCSRRGARPLRGRRRNGTRGRGCRWWGCDHDDGAMHRGMHPTVVRERPGCIEGVCVCLARGQARPEARAFGAGVELTSDVGGHAVRRTAGVAPRDCGPDRDADRSRGIPEVDDRHVRAGRRRRLEPPRRQRDEHRQTGPHPTAERARAHVSLYETTILPCITA
jgi:hypothetical protein